MTLKYRKSNKNLMAEVTISLKLIAFTQAHAFC